MEGKKLLGFLTILVEGLEFKLCAKLTGRSKTNNEGETYYHQEHLQSIAKRRLTDQGPPQLLPPHCLPGLCPPSHSSVSGFLICPLALKTQCFLPHISSSHSALRTTTDTPAAVPSIEEATLWRD